MVVLQIRRAVAADADILARLRVALQREVGVVNDDLPAEQLVNAYRTYFAARIPTSEFVAWVADADGQIVATSGLVLGHRPPSPNNLTGVDAYVMNMFTEPDWRGRGVGRALLDELVGHVAGTHVGRVWLHASEPGRSLYEKAGFAPVASSESEMELLLG